MNFLFSNYILIFLISIPSITVLSFCPDPNLYNMLIPFFPFISICLYPYFFLVVWKTFVVAAATVIWTMSSLYLLIYGHLLVCLVKLYFSLPWKWQLREGRHSFMFAHHCMYSAKQSAWLIVGVNRYLLIS